MTPKSKKRKRNDTAADDDATSDPRKALIKELDSGKYDVFPIPLRRVIKAALNKPHEEDASTCRNGVWECSLLVRLIPVIKGSDIQERAKTSTYLYADINKANIRALSKFKTASCFWFLGDEDEDKYSVLYLPLSTIKIERVEPTFTAPHSPERHGITDYGQVAWMFNGDGGLVLTTKLRTWVYLDAEVQPGASVVPIEAEAWVRCEVKWKNIIH